MIEGFRGKGNVTVSQSVAYLGGRQRRPPPPVVHEKKTIELIMGKGRKKAK